MAIEITMPQLSDTMDQGTILSWLKKEGEEVERGDALAEVATDKADLEIESFHEGVLLKILSPEGATVKVGDIIAVIGNAGEEVAATNGTSSPQAVAQQPEEIVQAAPQQEVAAPAPQVSSPTAPAPASASAPDARVKASPLAKNLAQSHGVDLTQVSGTGEGGRIVKKDIERSLGQEVAGNEVSAPAAAPQPLVSPVSQSPVQQAPVSEVQPTQQQASSAGVQGLSRMRTAIASQMVKSTTEIPHFYMTAKIEVDALAKMRESLKPLPQYEGITFNHMIVKAAADTLKKHPRINSAYKDGGLLQPDSVNVGIVTALPDGLLIPVVKNAAEISLADIVLESHGLVQRARAGKPKPDDLTGGTFSISNVGRLPVENFTAIINPSQGAILAVSGIQEEVLVQDGEMYTGRVMRVTLSVDHRIIDGVFAGEFLADLKNLIEDPVLLLA